MSASSMPARGADTVRPPAADVVPIVLRLPRGEIAYVKFLVESYEGIGVVRTLDRYEARLVIMAVPDFLPEVRTIVDGLCADVPGCEELAFAVAGGEDWLGPDEV